MPPTSLSVLVVDDSRVARERLVALLVEFGHQVVGLASDGAEAVSKFETLRPDMVTMDITMPGMDGIAATRRIMEAWPSAVVVMVSSHGQEAMILDALDAGATDYIIKTADKETLRDALQRIGTRHIQKPSRPA
jgi:two-component system chemotaxis response regulator CheY